MNQNEDNDKAAIAQLAGVMSNAMLHSVTGHAKLHWQDTVYAAALAIKAVGLVAMELDAAPLTLEQTLAQLRNVFEAAMRTTVVPNPQPDGEALVSGVSKKH